RSFIREHGPTITNAAQRAKDLGRMDRVFAAVNALQSVPWSINEPVLNFMHRLEASELVPNADARRIFEIDKRIAVIMAGHSRFWTAMNIDCRGRVYGLPHFNFGREDHVRGLFQFADGAPIGEEGLFWLKVNLWGHACTGLAG